MIMALAGPKPIVTLGSTPLRKPACFQQRPHFGTTSTGFRARFVPKCVSGADNSCQSAKQPVPFENAFRSSTCTMFPYHFTTFHCLNRRPELTPSTTCRSRRRVEVCCQQTDRGQPSAG